MTYAEIEAFLCITDCGSFSAAAEQLFITQPAMGRRIKALEDELGYPLFIRRKGIRHVEMTRQGQAFISIALRWKELWQETQEFSLLNQHHSLFLSGVGSLLTFLLPEVFQEFMKLRPECTLHITNVHSADAYRYLDTRSTELALISDPMFSTRYKTVMLFKEKLCLVTGSRLNLPSEVSLTNLDSRSEIRTSWDTDFTNWHNFYFGAASIPRIHLDEMGFLQYFLQTGENWAFLPSSIAGQLLKTGSIHIHTLDITPPRRTIYYVYDPAHVSDYQEEFLSLCRAHLRTKDGVTLMSGEPELPVSADNLADRAFS